MLKIFESLSPILFLLGCICCDEASAQGAYDEKPLRGNLADVPFANTSLGRENHRFAGAEVNRYRIYDYYKRQAQWHLQQPPPAADQTELLLPFTGLDGGRRGHWGVTNEPSIQAYKRQASPILPPLLSRGAYGLPAMTFPNNKAVVIYDVKWPGVRQVFTEAKLISPPGPFRGAVDCWGFSIKPEGNLWAEVNAPEWSAGQERISFRGYHMSSGEVACRHRVGAAEFLEQITLDGSAENLVMIRRFAFTEGIPEMRFTPHSTTSIVNHADGTYLSIAGEGGLHSLITGGGDIKSALDPNGKTLILSSAKQGSWLELRTWKGKHDAAELTRIQKIPARDPLQTRDQKKPSYEQTVVTTGTTNADPAAAKSAYEIDDIGIPFDNPWNQPMTLSGIDFDDKGIAYVCTMVGDVWRVEGLDRDLRAVTWQRYASGLNLPMGLTVVDGVPYVSCRHQIMKLHDHNGDHEADQYEQFNQVPWPLGGENGGDLRRDEEGNFYQNGGAGIFRLSADGLSVTKVGDGSRNPLGIGVRKDGLVLSDSSEGDGYNGTCTVFESEHATNAKSTSKKRRILYLPRGIDSSPGSRLFLNEPRFGPLGQSLLGISYSGGGWYFMLRDDNEGTPQAALIPMLGNFASSSMRLAKNPLDGQIYVVGLDGWGDYAVQESCFHRLRYNGKKCLVPEKWQAHRNGLMVQFNEPIDPASLQSDRFFAQQWNTVDYASTYGSVDYSVRTPQEIGHDRLIITRIFPQADARSVFFEIPALLPAMYTQLYGTITAQSGEAHELDLYCTINQMRADFPGATPASTDKPNTLVVREELQNGNTYEVLTRFFDQKAGRDVIERSVAEAVPWDKDTIDYEWVRKNVIEQKCILCHQSGTPHDLSNYDQLSTKLVPGNPHKSHILGLLKTNTMPPYPLPLLNPSDIKAIEHWITIGAPKVRP